MKIRSSSIAALDLVEDPGHVYGDKLKRAVDVGRPERIAGCRWCSGRPLDGGRVPHQLSQASPSTGNADQDDEDRTRTEPT